MEEQKKVNKYYFEIQGKVFMEQDRNKSLIKSTKMRLLPSNNMDTRQYVEKGIPTKDGADAQVKVLCVLLASAIRFAETKGFKVDKTLEMVHAKIDEGVFHPSLIGEDPDYDKNES